MIINTLQDLIEEKKMLYNAGIYFINSLINEDFLSYAELYGAALTTLHALQKEGIKPKDELVFQLEDNKSFIILFWACILGGIVPVPLKVGNTNDHRLKVFEIWPLLNHPYLISAKDTLSKLESFAKNKINEALFFKIKSRSVNETLISYVGQEQIGTIYKAKEDSIAFVQFSSGSTGKPKGVVLTHLNLITNIIAISIAAEYNDQDSMLSWMPLSHDMGLIGFHLNPIFLGINHYLISTNLFIRRPEIWLSKATEHNITVTCSPNFGFSYVLKHCRLETLANWDLSAIRIIFNGAEPISEKVATEFTDKLISSGLKKSAMTPVYGLAEATLAVSITSIDQQLISLKFDRNRLKVSEKFALATNEAHAVSFINVGIPVQNCAVRVVDDQGRMVGSSIIGNIQIKGKNVTNGYYNNKLATESVLTADGWLNTGDLGLFIEKSLYVTGRSKDIIFVNGQNYYPHDIERVAEEVEGIELNKIIVAGTFNQEMGRDEICAFVFFREAKEKFIPLALELKKIINKTFGFEFDYIFPVKELPRTTSGKLQRFKLIEQFSEGIFDALKPFYNFNNSNLEKLTSYADAESLNKLLDICKRILRIDHLNGTEDFFEIGGNSLYGGELLTMISKEFQVEISFDQLYECSDLQSIFKLIKNLPKSEVEEIKFNGKSENRSLSLAQKRLYYFWEINKDTTAYNIPIALKLQGELVHEKLESALNELVKEYEILNVSFIGDEEPKSTVISQMYHHIEQMNCPADQIDDLLGTLVKPFNLTQGPLFIVKLISTGPEMSFLFLDFHHIISDGKSVYLFIEELFNRYNGRKGEKSIYQFKNYVEWESYNRMSPKIKRQKKYWLEKFSDDFPILDFPADYNRPALFDYSGKKKNHQLSPGALNNLKQVSKSANCSLHNLLFAAYTLLLYRYTQQQESIVGIPVSGRSHNVFFDALGMFVNNLAIKSSINIELSFSDFLQIQKDNLNEAFENQEFLFSDLIDQLNLKRDVSRNPIFDTMFNYQNFGFPKINQNGLSVSYHPFNSGISKFDLSMEVIDFGDSMFYSIEYSTKLFSESTIDSMSNTFENLLNRVIANPSIKLSNLLKLHHEKHHFLIYDFNDTASFYNQDKCVIDYFEEQVKLNPDHVAIVNQDEHITYKELNKRANFVATKLKKLGMFEGNKCAVVLPRSPEYLISILAILKLGACFIPIDTDYPAERVCYIIENSQSAFIIKLESNPISFAEKWSNTNQRDTVIVDIDSSELYGNTEVNPVVSRSSSDLAYIIYTSGTTGNPKGVMISNLSLLNYLLWSETRYLNHIGHASFPLYTSISFDLTITSVFLPLCTGNRIVIYGENNNNMSLLEVLEDNQVEVIKLTPSHLKILLNHSILNLVKGFKAKRLIVGGENFEPALAREISRLLPENVEIFNEYGPTEATVGCMIHQYEEDIDVDFISLGIPIANIQIYILDQRLSPVPEGVPGEIYIAGAGLAAGYLNNEELTALTFLENPFVRGEKMYKTGDLAKRYSDGRIVFLGRRDKQVKINGYRIELSEIEKYLLLYPSLKQVVVALVGNVKEIAVLTAYYCSLFFEEIHTNELRSHLLKFLPHYMVPKAFVRVESIPLTVNGKIDYAALYKIKIENAEIIALSLNEVEMKMLGIWTDLFKNNNISILNNYFELGGDSIKAVQIVSRLNSFGILLSVKDILSYQTIKEIAPKATFTNITNQYTQLTVTGDKELSPIESWFFLQKFINPSYYNQSILLSVDPEVDVRLLEKAFHKLINYHDGIRINYNQDKQLLFYSTEAAEQNFYLEELNTETVDGPKGSLADIYENLRKNFDITKSLLIHSTILNVSLSERYLFISAHHLIIDGVSWRIILNDLYTTYKSLSNGDVCELPLKTASLTNWVDLLKKTFDAGNFEEEQEYWQNVEDVEFSLPVDMETNDWRVTHAKKINGSLSYEQTAFLTKESHKAYKTDLPMLLNLSLALAINKWTGIKDIIIEQENHGRDTMPIDVSRTVGWFTNIYPLHLHIEDNDFDKQIKLVKERMRNVPGNGANYGPLKFWNKDINTIEAVRSEVRFNYLGQFDSEFNNDVFSYDPRYTGLDTDPENHLTTKLEFNLIIVGGRMQIEITYNKCSYKPETIQKIMDDFILFLGDILSHIAKQEQIHFTPSDFELANLNQGEIDSLFE